MKSQFGNIIVWSLMAVLLLYGTSLAAFTETEAGNEKGLNDSMGTADPISRGSIPWADVGVMHLADGGGDVDFFSLYLEAGEIVTVTTTPLADLFVMPDTILGLFSNNGSLLAMNDDAGSSEPGDPGDVLGSRVDYPIPRGETYYIGVTGLGDDNFDGNLDSVIKLADTMSYYFPHEQVGGYALTVTIVPEPTSLSLIIMGFIPLLRRRKTA